MAIIDYVASDFCPVQGTHFLTSRGSLVPILAALAVLAISPTTSVASLLDFQPDSPMEILLAQRAIADSSSVPATPPILEPAVEPAVEPDAGLAPQKSVGKAFLLDLAVPGTGHLYAGKKRGWAYLGVEVAAWIAYMRYNDLGRQKETEFEAYADAHWSYDTWVNSDPGNPGSDADKLILGFLANNKQQYYEDIGKINTYWSGWDSSPTLETKDFYRGIRAHSNNFLKDAHIAIVGAFVNRIVSAADVLHSMKKRGASLDANTKLRFRAHTKPFSKDNAFGLELIRRI